MFATLFMTITLLAPNPASAAASPADRKLDEKLKLEQNTDTLLDLQNETWQRINNFKGINEAKKKKLNQLGSNIYAQIRPLDRQYLRLRGALMNNVVSDFDANERKLIRARLRSLSARRIEILMAGAESARKILKSNISDEGDWRVGAP